MTPPVADTAMESVVDRSWWQRTHRDTSAVDVSQFPRLVNRLGLQYGT